MMRFLPRTLLLTALVCLVTCLPKAPANCLLDVPAKDNLSDIPEVGTGEVKRELPGIKGILKTLGIGVPTLPKVSDPQGLVEKVPSLPSLGVPGAPGLPDPQSANVLNRLNKIESVLKLSGIMKVEGSKTIASSGKDEEIEKSEETCRSLGGKMVTPMNEAENNAMLYFLKKYNQYAYIGLKEGPITGIFHYQNGIPALYTHWRKNEPSGKGQEKCVEVYTDGSWNDKACNQRRLTVCEF